MASQDGPLKELLDLGIGRGVFPGAVLLVSVAGRVRFFRAAGSRSIVPATAPMEKHTIFDLASLTKPLATTLAAMKLVSDGLMDLDRTLPGCLSATMPEDKRRITLRMLLNHSSGFPDWRPYYSAVVSAAPRDRKSRLRDLVLRERLTDEPGRTCRYSDLGFIALEWALERICGMALPQYLEQNFYAPLALGRTFLWSSWAPSPFEADEFAATEACSWRKRVMRGEVHDENAYAAGGFAGHAGLFGTAEDVHALADMLRSTYRGAGSGCLKGETVRTFFTRTNAPLGSTWALGWDTPSEEGSSAGRYFSANSVGHLGFTGTSLWIDLDRDVIVVFLTNRVHPTRDNEKIRAFRPMVHDAAMAFCGLEP